MGRGGRDSRRRSRGRERWDNRGNANDGRPDVERRKGGVKLFIGRIPQEVVLPKLVAKAAAVCNFHGLQQATPSASTPGGTSVAGPRKFLLVSQACGHKGAAEAPHLVALCAGAVKEGMLNVRVTVKGGSQEEVEAVKGELAAALKEAVAAAV
eukprot:g18191.t1